MSLTRKMLPIGVENFEKLRRNDMYYVDKTEIIADLLRNHGDASLITRPRRFGKTLTILIFIFDLYCIFHHTKIERNRSSIICQNQKIKNKSFCIC